VTWFLTRAITFFGSLARPRILRTSKSAQFEQIRGIAGPSVCFRKVLAHVTNYSSDARILGSGFMLKKQARAFCEDFSDDGSRLCGIGSAAGC